YFANREGTRYLVRTIEVSEPPDEMDREALAQAVEWSLQALVEGSAGLTRAQAEALFSDDSASPSPTPKEVSQVSEKPPGAFRSTSGGWVPEVALLHAWAPHSGEMLATQGPALRLGADFLTGR